MLLKKLLLTAAGLIFTASMAHAGPTCTKEPREKWQDQEKFKKELTDQGYKIKKFKVTKGNCYEIYGWNAKGQRVEIYFNPVTGKIEKEELED
jgi:hypothetical protein